MIPRLHPDEEHLLGLCIILGPTAGFTLLDRPVQAAVYAVLMMTYSLGSLFYSMARFTLDMRRRRREARWHEERTKKLIAEGRHFEAGQAFIDWQDWLDRNRPKN